MSELVSERPGWVQRLAEAAHGVTAEQLSRFTPPSVGARPSAVLIAIAETATDPAVLLIERAATLRTHAGQIAFPGGGVDSADVDAADTALREASEEVGLRRSSVDVLATLPALFLPPSGFVVSPVVGWWAQPHAVQVVDRDEVAAVHLVSIGQLADPDNRFRVPHPSGFVGPGFDAGGLFIWGFTAGLLDAVLHLGGWFRPWDTRRERPVPAVAVGNTAGVGTVRP